MYIYELSKEFLKIAEFEVVLGNDEHVLINNYLFSRAMPKNPLFSYTKSIYKIISDDVSNAKELKSLLKISKSKKSYGIFFKNIKDKSKFKSTVTKSLQNESLVVDLKTPDMSINIIKIDKEYITVKVWQNDEDFEKRKMKNLPSPHPTGMNPRLARSLVNIGKSLSKKNTLLDPFCGAGGILIEANLIGLKTEGWDIDKIQIKRSKNNLAHLKLKSELKIKDALTLSSKTSLVVTDLPYGKNSKKEDKNLASEFLKLNHIDTMILGNNSLLKIPKHYKTINKFTVPLNRSLNKYIYILKKK